MKFKAVMSADSLKAMLNAITCVAEEVKIEVSPEGIHVKAADPANVALVDLRASAKAFTFYQAETGMFALEPQSILSLLAGKNDVSLEIEEQMLKLSSGATSYKLRLFDPSTLKEPPRIPELDLPAIALIDASDFRQSIEAVAKILDKSALITVTQGDAEDPQMFRISAKSQQAEAVSEFPLAEVLVKEGLSNSRMPLEYIMAATKPMQGKVMIETGINYPMVMSWSIGDSIDVKYIVAPRMDD